jgi:inorganic pyrophosphatase
MKAQESTSLKMCREFLGKKVEIIIDQALGSVYEGAIYSLNYGYVPGTMAPDGEGLDAYFLDSKEPLKKAEGICIAIIHRLEDDDDKLILAKEGKEYLDSEIEELVNFREKYFKHIIIR